MKELLEKKFKNRDELDRFLKLSCGFQIPTIDEINEWPYKSKLNISPSFLCGRRVFVNGKDVGGVEKLSCEKIGTRNGIVIYTHTGNKVALSNAKVEYFDDFKKEIKNISVHPTKNKTLWEKGFVIDEYDYKKLYYQTDEYREQYEASLNKNQGTVGIKAPIQSKKIKEKISNTISERYGVDWFLDRGKHYSAITLSMLEKHGVENVFLSEDWQIKMNRLKNEKYKAFGVKFIYETSIFERELTSKLEDIFKEEESYHFYSDNGQFVIERESGEYFYKVDYYNKSRNIIIEALGDYWHCNPKKFNADYTDNKLKKTAKQIWEEDEKRKNYLINKLNCKFIEVWESDWKKNKESVLKRIIELCQE